MTELQFDEILRNSVKKYGENYIDLTDDMLLPHVFSKSSERKNKKLFRRSPYYSPSLFTVLRKKRLATAFTIIILLSATAVSTGAISKIFGNFLTDAHEKYTTVQMNKTDFPPNSFEKIYEISYIPEGFELVDKTESDTFRDCKFKNNDNFFHFVQWLHSEYNVDVNTEGHEMSEIIINGYNGIEVKMDDYIYIAMDYENYILEIRGFFNEEEAVKIAESIYIAE